MTLKEDKFYYVKTIFSDDITVAEYTRAGWFIIGFGESFGEDEIEVIKQVPSFDLNFSTREEDLIIQIAQTLTKKNKDKKRKHRRLNGILPTEVRKQLYLLIRRCREYGNK